MPNAVQPPTKKQRHTPTPWKVIPPNACRPSVAYVAACDGQVDIYNAPLTEETRANAEFIERACNCHDDLLEALTKLANEAEGFLAHADPSTHGVTNMRVLSGRISEARTAIAKAEVKVEMPPTTKMIEVKHCAGCREDFYNGNNPFGVKECLHRKDAKLVSRLLIGIDWMPPYTTVKPEMVPHCYKRDRYATVKPESLTADGYWRF